MIKTIITAILFTVSTEAMAAEVDVLFVIDDSGSMESYQTILAAAAPTYAAQVLRNGDDVNVAVVTTSMEATTLSTCCGLFKGQTNSKLPTFATDMATLFQVGVSGSGFEKPIDAANSAFEQMLTRPENGGFLRANSQVKVIFITDAFDQSAMTPADLLQTLNRIVGSGRYSISAAFIPAMVTAPACARDNIYDPNIRIEILIGATGGQSIDLCAPTFAATVADIF